MNEEGGHAGAAPEEGGAGRLGRKARKKAEKD
jgi:hypothetical protein